MRRGFLTLHAGLIAGVAVGGIAGLIAVAEPGVGVKALQPGWAFAGSSPAQGAFLALGLLALFASLPAGWLLLKKVRGPWAAGPLWVLLFFELVAGAYAIVTPPWLTPDEPRHMEYVEVVQRSGLEAPTRVAAGQALSPGVAQVQAEVTRDILDSMRQTEVVRWQPIAAGGLAQGEIPGPIELPHPPLYYVVAAELTRPFSGHPLVARLAILRVFGVVLAGWVVWACGAAGRLLWPSRPRLSEAPVAMAVAVPTFAAFAGTVNNDVMANLLAALLVLVLLAGVLRRSVFARAVPWALAIGAIVAAGLLTKRTFVPLIALVPLAVVIRLRRHARLILGYGLAAMVALTGLLVLASAPRAALWKSESTWKVHSATVMNRCEAGYVGKYAFCLEAGKGTYVAQSVPLQRVHLLEGNNISLGLWTRGFQPDQTLTISLNVHVVPLTETVVAVPRSWTFVRLSTHVPPRAGAVHVTVLSQGPGYILVDGVVLALGRFTDRPPSYLDDGAVSMVWEGVSVRNELANGSAEMGTVAPPRFLPEQLRRVLQGGMDAVDSALRQPGRVYDSSSVVGERVATSVSMFWGTVGWGIPPPPLFPPPLRWALVALTGIALTVGVATMARPGELALTGQGMGVLAGAAGFAFLSVLLREVIPVEPGLLSGRYLFPGIVAFTAVIAVGTRRLWLGDDRSFRRACRLFAIGIHIAFMGLVWLPFLTP